MDRYAGSTKRPAERPPKAGRTVTVLDTHEKARCKRAFDIGGEGGIDSALRTSPLRGAGQAGVCANAPRWLSNHHSGIEGSNNSLGATNEKRPHRGTFLRLAEREGFEPSIGY